MNKIALGKRINQARKKGSMTGEQLSELCGINATYLRQIESGMKTPSLPMFVTICQQLRVSPYYLLQDDLCPAQPESDSPEELLERLRHADPEQLRLVTAVLRTLLQELEQ